MKYLNKNSGWGVLITGTPHDISPKEKYPYFGRYFQNLAKNFLGECFVFRPFFFLELTCFPITSWLFAKHFRREVIEIEVDYLWSKFFYWKHKIYFLTKGRHSKYLGEFGQGEFFSADSSYQRVSLQIPRVFPNFGRWLRNNNGTTALWAVVHAKIFQLICVFLLTPRIGRVS